MAQVELLFRNGKIATAGKIIDGFVAVDKEKIVAVGEGDTAPQALKTIDLKGRTLIPGVVDPEVHFGSHRWVGDEFDSETRGAAAYGIKAARAAAAEGDRDEAGRRECEWQRARLPSAIRGLVLDDVQLRNELCWFVFSC